MAGAFIYAELAERMPQVGGQYAYLREAYHPLLGFLYGLICLLVIHAGGSAAVAVTFAKYFRVIWHDAIPEKFIAVAVVLVFTVVNCLGVRTGGGVQSVFMLLRIVAVAMIVACGVRLIFSPPANAAPTSWFPLLDRPLSFDLLTVFGATMIPVLFAYGGFRDLELRSRRNSRAAQEFAASAAARRDRAVCSRELYLRPGAFARRPGGHCHSCIGGAGPSTRFAGRLVDRGGHRSRRSAF